MLKYLVCVGENMSRKSSGEKFNRVPQSNYKTWMWYVQSENCAKINKQTDAILSDMENKQARLKLLVDVFITTIR